MFAALIVRRWPEAAGGSGFHRNSLQIAVKGEVEVEPGLFAVRDHIETGFDLIRNSDPGCVVDHFRQVVLAELIQMLGRKLQPPRKWITSHDCRS